MKRIRKNKKKHNKDKTNTAQIDKKRIEGREKKNKDNVMCL
jgi:hypothetical protein